MGSNQMLMTIGALVLLSILILTANRSVLSNTRMTYTGQYTLNAMSIGQSYLQEISAKNFDRNVINAPVIRDPNNFTPISGFGPSGSYYSNFNDIDDYHGFTKNVTLPKDDSTVYRVACTVEYVNQNDFETASYSPTFFKKITITVELPNPDSLKALDNVTGIKLSTVVAYY